MSDARTHESPDELASQRADGAAAAPSAAPVKAMSALPIWLVLLAAAGAFALTMGVRLTMGLYLSPLNSATGLGMANISLRSVGDYDVSAIAKTFGGGGHRNAAGFEVSFDRLKFIEGVLHVL